MVRSIAIIIVTFSFLLCSSQLYSGSPLVFPVTEEDPSCSSSGCTCAAYGQPGSQGHAKGSCPLVGHRHRVGQSGFSYGTAQLAELGVARRLGAGGPCPFKTGRNQEVGVVSGRMVVRIQDPTGATPGYLVELPDQPGARTMSGRMIVRLPDPTGATPGYLIELPDQPGAVPGQVIAVQGVVPGQVVYGQIEKIIPGVQEQMPVEPQPAGGFLGGMLRPRSYQEGYANAYGYPIPVQERIVYVPYAMPPPIHVERLKALPVPMPLPQLVRRVLGETPMYEYPEMPLHLYTTRGPRDFFVPTPPGIGE